MKQTFPSTALRNLCRSNGFSLIELMVVVSILAVLAAIAGPSFGESIKRYRVTSVRDDLMSTLQLARTEAIRRGFPVVMQRTTGCGATLVDANDWSCGWEVFVDANANGTKQVGELVVQNSTVPLEYGVMHTGLGASVVFNVWGQAQGVGQIFVLSPPEGVTGKSTATICVTSGGRIRKLVGVASC